MKKIYTLAYTTTVENETSYSFLNAPTPLITFRDGEIREAFKTLREELDFSYETITEEGFISCRDNFFHNISISIADIEKDTARIKKFRIKSENLKKLQEKE